MNRSSRVTSLSYSKIPSMPILGPLSYTLQSYLYQKGVINSIFISRKETDLQKRLLKKISKSNRVIVKSAKFGRLLKSLSSGITLDISVKDLEKLSQKDLYDLMWSLVLSKYITRRTRQSLKDFVLVNFPIRETTVIPYNQHFGLVADFVLQTAKALARKGHTVYLVAFAYPSLIVSYPFKRLFKRKIEVDYLNYPNLQVVYPFKLFPYALDSFSFFKRTNRVFAIITGSLFVRGLNNPILWCFDHQDLELARLTKRHSLSLYDCVDYFSTLDPTLDRKIQKRESELIRAVHYFFVNSHALEKVKKHIRKPDAIVPQGFDINSFESRRSLSQKEKVEIKNIKRIFRNIPRPRVGFVGNLTYRLDFELLHSVITKMPNVSFVFTDAFLPMPEDDKYKKTEKLIKDLKSFKNVYLVPRTKNRRVIKEIIRKFDIGIIPYDTSLDFNRYCYPMKLFEYFYMGKPVISTPIDELKRFPKFVKIGESSIDWEKHIKSLLSMSWPVKYKEEQKLLSEENRGPIFLYFNSILEVIRVFQPMCRLGT